MRKIQCLRFKTKLYITLIQKVYSAYRILLRAKEQKIPSAIINIGKTRGDEHCDFKINTICSNVLKEMSPSLNTVKSIMYNI